MRLSAILTDIAIGNFAVATSVSYDTGYDQRTRSMTVVACSDGSNGLITRYGWNIQGDVPRFPYVGGSSTVAGWNSPNYRDRTVYILAVDHTANGFNIAKTAMDDLTNGQAYQLGRIEAQTAEVALSNCGL
ncbi:hypothetical protein H2199_004464 [Coniosporium tulheliwenetii]|uniref:Uncharacterized protein n=1 Tax=Coniosporium tulheliwenetii TaxID=3383036 RepID=A0ACC2Z5K8_9PEZI|nr:hypothetical protein H2199_004464 [Cladosporium sp. JES 115]